MKKIQTTCNIEYFGRLFKPNASYHNCKLSCNEIKNTPNFSTDQLYHYFYYKYLPFPLKIVFVKFPILAHVPKEPAL